MIGKIWLAFFGRLRYNGTVRVKIRKEQKLKLRKTEEKDEKEC